VNLDLVHN